MGRIALKSITYFEAATTLALVIGLVIVNVIRPGSGLTLRPDIRSRHSDEPGQAGRLSARFWSTRSQQHLRCA